MRSKDITHEVVETLQITSICVWTAIYIVVIMATIEILQLSQEYAGWPVRRVTGAAKKLLHRWFTTLMPGLVAEQKKPSPRNVHNITFTHFVTSTLRVFDIGQTMVALHFITFSVLAKKWGEEYEGPSHHRRHIRSMNIGLTWMPTNRSSLSHPIVKF